MKVVEDRSMQGDMPLEWDCAGCKSTLQADTPEDVKKGEFGGNYAERGETKLYVTCPICGADRSLTHAEVYRVPKARRMALGFYR